jgi:hypothetical protein
VAIAQVRTRSDLIGLLSAAAEVEHSLMCQYLFAAFSLKHDVDEGLTDAQLVRVEHWEKKILAVARQEMEHLGLVANLLTAIGAAPVLTRPDFPYATSLYGHSMALTPFSLATVEKFVCFEKPAVGGDPLLCPAPPAPDRFPNSVVVLWESIRAGFVALADETDLFLVGADHQLGGLTLGTDFPRVGSLGGGYDVFMSTVTDLPSALAAIDLIIEQGEASTVQGDEGHFVAFLGIHDELESMQKADPTFQPARAVVATPVTSPRVGATVLTDPLAVEVAELFDRAYQTMLRFLLRLLTSTDEDAGESGALAAVAFFPMMTMAIRPLAEILTSLPAQSPDDGTRAGPPFTIGGGVGFLPHRKAAWTVLQDELRGLAAEAERVSGLPGAPPRLAYVAETLALVARRFDFEIAGGTP